MKGFGDLYKDKKKKNKLSTEKIINQAIQLHLKGNITEATKYYKQLISQECTDQRVFSNYGVILQGLGKLQEAEKSYRKAIELNPKFAQTYSNLGNLLKDLGKLQEAELSYRKAIELNPNLAEAYFFLSNLKYSNIDTKWKNQLFFESFIINKAQKSQIDIYFARANVFHKEKNYKESAKCLELANNLKLDIYPSNSDYLIKQSKKLLIESDKKDIKEHKSFSESIFIVGMPRSGSTLLESILSMNHDVYDLGEINILEESFLESKKNDQSLTLADIYLRKKRTYKNEFNITTNKWLYNYQFAGIISNQIPNAKIIHCFRNPLDNILSIYRAHFANGNEYSSSLIDCAKVYLDQEDLMNKYKTRFRAKIYDLNYDLLVTNPNKEIKTLIKWLGWKWDDSYLSPHLNKRSVSTASSVQVRSPINSKSIGGWKNYKEMLKPAIEILTKTNRYQNLI